MNALEDMNAFEAAALLRFYVEAGVSDGLSDEPVDRYALNARAAQPATGAPAPMGPRTLAPERPTFSSSPPQVTSSPAAIPLESVEQAGEAKAIAASCSSLEELRAALEKFDACPLKHTAKNLVFADGNPESDIMLVGEAPGRDEDIQGLPFVGRSGQLLDRMLAAIGLSRTAPDRKTNTFISNVNYWRPPGNRNPTGQEAQAFLPFVQRHIELADPDIVLTMGNTPTKALLATVTGIKRMRGNWMRHGATGKPMLPTFHPAYLLRQPAQKALCWRDILAVKAKLIELG